MCDWEEDVSESFRISSATTAKPLPASPACAASMAAFMARRLVCSAIAEIAAFASWSICDCSSICLIRSLTLACFVKPISAFDWRLEKDSDIFSTDFFTEEILPIISSTAAEASVTLADCSEMSWSRFEIDVEIDFTDSFVVVTLEL